jgi:hypothetical protein
MNTDSVQLFRLILAAINGFMFALGSLWLMEVTLLAPRRWRKRLAKLLRDQTEGDHEDEEDREQEIARLRELLNDHFRSPRTLLNIGLGILMIGIALFALLGLIAPPWAGIVG